MGWFWLYLPHHHLSKLHNQLLRSNRVILSDQVLWGNCRMEVCDLTGCRWLLTLGNYWALFAQQIFNDSLYINLWELCWHLHLLDGPGHKQIWSAARKLWIGHFTASQYFISDGWGGRNDFIIGERIFVKFLTPYGEIRAISICSGIFHQRSWQKDRLTMLRSVF